MSASALQLCTFSELLDRFAQQHQTKARALPLTPEWWTARDAIDSLLAELHQRTR